MYFNIFFIFSNYKLKLQAGLEITYGSKGRQHDIFFMFISDQ
jgi:hypothetical protein